MSSSSGATNEPPAISDEQGYSSTAYNPFLENEPNIPNTNQAPSETDFLTSLGQNEGSRPNIWPSGYNNNVFTQSPASESSSYTMQPRPRYYSSSSDQHPIRASDRIEDPQMRYIRGRNKKSSPRRMCIDDRISEDDSEMMSEGSNNIQLLTSGDSGDCMPTPLHIPPGYMAADSHLADIHERLEKIEEKQQRFSNRFTLHEDNIDELQERLCLHEYGNPGSIFTSFRFFIAIIQCTVVPLIIVEVINSVLFS